MNNSVSSLMVSLLLSVSSVQQEWRPRQFFTYLAEEFEHVNSGGGIRLVSHVTGMPVNFTHTCQKRNATLVLKVE